LIEKLRALAIKYPGAKTMVSIEDAGSVCVKEASASSLWDGKNPQPINPEFFIFIE